MAAEWREKTEIGMSHNSHVLFHCQLENKENIGWLTFRFDHKKNYHRAAQRKKGMCVRAHLCVCEWGGHERLRAGVEMSEG